MHLRRTKRDSEFFHHHSLDTSNMEFPFFQHFQFSSITFVIRICSLCSLIMKHFETRLISICTHISNNKLSFLLCVCMCTMITGKISHASFSLSTSVFNFLLDFSTSNDDDDCEYIIERQKERKSTNETIQRAHGLCMMWNLFR